MTTPANLPTKAGEPGAGTTADEAVVPTGHDMPLSVSLLVFARDRGIFVLWGLLIAVFAFWCSPYFFKVDNAILILNAGALTALFAAGVGIGVMTGVLDLSLPGTAAISSCVCGWLLTHGHATWLSLVAGLGCGLGARGGGGGGGGWGGRSRRGFHPAGGVHPDHRHHRHPLGAHGTRRGGGR